MELDELKKSWKNFDAYLEDKEIVSNEEFSKMISRANKQISDISSLSMKIGIASLFIIAISGLSLFLYHKFDIIYFIIAVSFIPAICWDTYSIYYLNKTDVYKLPLVEVIKRINTCNRWMIREQIISILYLIIIGVTFFIHYDIAHLGVIPIAIFISSCCVGMALIVWLYKKIFISKIKEIKKNLHELNECS